MRLGDLEQRILLACLSRHQPKHEPPRPDVWRAELPGLLWGWKQAYVASWRQPRRVSYEAVSVGEYRVHQAALSRALTTLYDKGLIRVSFAYHGFVEPLTGIHGISGRAKGIRLTPLGLEVAFLRLTWKPRRPGVPDLTPIYQVKSGTTSPRRRRQTRRQRRSWVTVFKGDR
jgi:hypothetical protein